MKYFKANQMCFLEIKEITKYLKTLKLTNNVFAG